MVATDTADTDVDGNADGNADDTHCSQAFSLSLLSLLLLWKSAPAFRIMSPFHFQGKNHLYVLWRVDPTAIHRVHCWVHRLVSESIEYRETTDLRLRFQRSIVRTLCFWDFSYKKNANNWTLRGENESIQHRLYAQFIPNFNKTLPPGYRWNERDEEVPIHVPLIFQFKRKTNIF